MSLSHRDHSGKLLSHRHTSYAGLALLLMVTAVLLASVSYESRADGSASSTVSLTVAGPAPSQAAIITSPVDGQDFSDNSIVISGTCPVGTRVDVSRNGIFAGSALCHPDGSFSIAGSLVPGSNVLSAGDYDGLNQAGPSSAAVTVTYALSVTPPPAPPPVKPPTPPSTPPPAPSPAPAPAPSLPARIISGISSALHGLFGGEFSTKAPAETAAPAAPVSQPFMLTSATHFMPTVSVSQPLTWQLLLVGGLPPFALNWDWGDGEQSLMSASQADPTGQHIYKQKGQYQITVSATDISHQTAKLQMFEIVENAVTPPVSTTSKPPESPTDQGVNMAWPLLGGVTLLVMCFWLGEKYIKDSIVAGAKAI